MDEQARWSGNSGLPSLNGSTVGDDVFGRVRGFLIPPHLADRNRRKYSHAKERLVTNVEPIRGPTIWSRGFGKKL